MGRVTIPYHYQWSRAIRASYSTIDPARYEKRTMLYYLAASSTRPNLIKWCRHNTSHNDNLMVIMPHICAYWFEWLFLPVFSWMSCSNSIFVILLVTDLNDLSSIPIYPLYIVAEETGVAMTIGKRKCYHRLDSLWVNRIKMILRCHIWGIIRYNVKKSFHYLSLFLLIT